MANPNLKSFVATPIVVDGDDLVIDGVVMPVKQKLVFGGLSYNEDLSELGYNPNQIGYVGNPAGLRYGNSVVVTIQVMLYKRNEDGTFGERLKGGIIPEYQFQIIANNSTLVDDATGEVLGQVGEEEKEEFTRPPLFDATGAEVQSAGKLYGRTFIKEGEFFDRLASQESQIGVRLLIQQYIETNKSRVQPKGRF